MRNLDTITINLQENIIINTSRCFLERGGSNLLFFCTDAPLFRSLREQVKSKQHLLIENNQLDGPYLVLLYYLSR
jgi:hypothetical protein